ncbi:DUF2316 family protein [Listeria weihenstephanensis]|uniref:DUF2316 family protein n=1 Tax=Listeria weihenstephanensis TaxID=1006155 RepID=A0A841Z5N6_9LIST|nr:DUF2316 family protein [Listeria weihenstephanensis]MBC1501261.1 DUF2316 family protein [Listeria weihenstephanensis]
MTLTNQQIANTKKEFADNIQISGLSIPTIAKELNTNEEKIESILALNTKAFEDGWILRNYLLEKIKEQGKQPEPFTALVGDHHDYWFLNARKIDKRKMS